MIITRRSQLPIRLFVSSTKTIDYLPSSSGIEMQLKYETCVYSCS